MLVVECSSPCYVVQFAEGNGTSDDEFGGYMIVIPAVSQYSRDYHFVTLRYNPKTHGPFTSNFVSGSESGLLLDGV